MQQNQHEFFALLDLLQQRGVKTVVEVGSSHGGALVFYDQIVGADGLVVGVENAPEYAFSVHRTSPFKPISDMNLIEGDSHLWETVDRVEAALKGRPLDFLFIDGDHSYEGAKQDLEMFGPLVRSGGIIGFHDVAIEPRVRRLFDEVEIEKEILPVHHMGIGLFYKP